MMPLMLPLIFPEFLGSLATEVPGHQAAALPATHGAVDPNLVPLQIGHVFGCVKA